MNPLRSSYRRAARALVAVALLGASWQAAAVDPATAGLNVLVIDETRRGWDKGVLDRYGISARVSPLNQGDHAKALRDILRDENVRLRLAMPTGCPAGSTREACPSVRQIKDVDLPAVVAEAKGSKLIVLWPEAAYFPSEKLYISYVDVDIIENGKARPGPFYLGYRDWECTEECVPSAFEASAKEIAAMVRYLLEVGPSPKTRSVPVSWQTKPLVTSLSKWDNTCATKLEDNRVVRQYGERVWLSDPKTRTLTSTAWRGCNIFDSGS